MKRTLAIAALCMLLIATVGTTAASAYTWTPSLYTFGVKTDAGHRYTGTIMVNTKNTASPTYSFTGYGLKPGTTYYLYYTTTTGKHAVGSAVANWWGRVSLRGAWTNPVADLTQKPVFTLSTTAPKIQPKLTLTVDQPTVPAEILNTITFTAHFDPAITGANVELVWEEHYVSWSMTDNGDGTYTYISPASSNQGNFFAFHAEFLGNDRYLPATSDTVTVTFV